MELMAAVQALEALSTHSRVQIYTDSKYLLQGITQWAKIWQANDWMTVNKQPVKNQELWRRLLKVSQRHQVDWAWVRGHQGHLGNQLADRLAQQAARGVAPNI